MFEFDIFFAYKIQKVKNYIIALIKKFIGVIPGAVVMLLLISMCISPGRRIIFEKYNFFGNQIPLVEQNPAMSQLNNN